jgi:hypothetical protein
MQPNGNRTALDRASSGALKPSCAIEMLDAADHAAVHPDDPTRHIRRTRAR